MSGDGFLVLTPREEKALHRYLQHPFLTRDLQDRIESYVEQKTGKPWDDPVALERVRTAIVSQKKRYWEKGRGSPDYRRGYEVLAYLAYQLPVFLTQFQHLLFLLARDGLLPEHPRVLDVGSGPGVVPLAVIDFFRRLGRGGGILRAIESSEEQVEAYRHLVLSAGRRHPGWQTPPPVLGDLTGTPEPEEDLDLIVFSSVLNELRRLSPGERGRILRMYAERLSPWGTMVVIEPADLGNATLLRQNVLAATQEPGLGIYAPCTFLWGDRCRSDRCWSFAHFGDMRPTRWMEALARGTEGYRFLNIDLKCSYALLRRDGRVRHPCRIPPRAPFIRLSRLDRHLNRRINVAAGVVSTDLGDQEHHVFLICDGTTVKPVYAVLPRYHREKGNRLLLETDYGDLLEIRGALVRYNPAHDSYNLLVTRETRVRRPGFCPAR